MNVDKNMNQKVVGYFEQLGVTAEQTTAYLSLLHSGPQTVLQLSRATGTGRTKLYPLLSELSKKRLVRQHERHYGTSYEALPPDTIETLVQEKELEAMQLRGGLAAIRRDLEKIQPVPSSAFRIAEFTGTDGAKQLLFNLSKTPGEILMFDGGIQSRLDSPFLHKLRTALATKNTVVRRLNNGNVLQKIGAVSRLITPASCPIEHDTYIYANSVAFLSVQGGEIAGAEITGSLLARQYRSLFDLAWAQATPE